MSSRSGDVRGRRRREKKELPRNHNLYSQEVQRGFCLFEAAESELLLTIWWGGTFHMSPQPAGSFQFIHIYNGNGSVLSCCNKTSSEYNRFGKQSNSMSFSGEIVYFSFENVSVFSNRRHSDCWVWIPAPDVYQQSVYVKCSQEGDELLFVRYFKHKHG